MQNDGSGQICLNSLFYSSSPGVVLSEAFKPIELLHGMPSTPRIVYYVQSRSYIQYEPGQGFDHDEKPVKPLSIVPLGEDGRRTSHVILSACHMNWTLDKTKYGGLHKLYLNDVHYDDLANFSLWDQVQQLQAKGVKVFAMIGTDCWAAGIPPYDGPRLNSPKEEDFEAAYALISDLMTNTSLDGVDLDIETVWMDNQPPATNQTVTKFIRRFRQEFRQKYTITMVPGGDELLGVRQMAGIDYQQLYRDIGDEIAWFNIQNYNGWGSPSPEYFQRLLDAKYLAEKLVMGVSTNPVDGSLWSDTASIKSGLEDGLIGIRKAYPNMGGFMGWEYYNATLDWPLQVGQIVDPLPYVDYVNGILFPSPPATS